MKPLATTVLGAAAAVLLFSPFACNNTGGLTFCKRDTDCKLDRICDRNMQACVYPLTLDPLDPSTGNSGANSSAGVGGAGVGGQGGGTASVQVASVSGTSTVTSTSTSTATGTSVGTGMNVGGGATIGAGGGSTTSTGAGGAPPECITASDCPGVDLDCRFRICIGGNCGMQNATSGTVCNDNGGDTCDGNGVCENTSPWTTTSSVNAPSARYGHVAVWTGTEMLVWGGRGAGAMNTNTGARYNPMTNTWTAMTTVNAPAARYLHKAVWTGTEMLVWGGFGAASYEQQGGRYNPSTNTWTAMTNTGAPSGRSDHAMVWTGSEMIVWGGRAGATALGNGARYNPMNNTWTAMATANDPSPRFEVSSVWAGDRMIVWGGADTFDWFDNGKQYDPAMDTWTNMSNQGALPGLRQSAGAVWDGNLVVFFGGWDGGAYQQDGGLFDPSNGATGFWFPLTGNNPPAPRAFHVNVWTGTKGLFVWGGCGGAVCTTYYDDGGVWLQDSWTPLPADVLSARRDATGVWTGTDVIIWGGRTTTANPLGDGAFRSPP